MPPTSPANDPCPVESVLSAWLEGSLPEAAEQSLSEHVETCAACEQILQRLESEPRGIAAELRASPAHAMIDSRQPITLTSEQFLQRVAESSVIAPADIAALLAALPPETQPADGEAFAQLLMRENKLTTYQSQQICAGQGKSLVLGNYVILDKIGAGGMGQVFKARHKRMNRLVAIKLLPPEVNKDLSMIKRFHREVEAAAKLTHPNIVIAHDADEAPGGIHFLVMEYVAGRDLAHLLAAEKCLPVERVLDYILQAAKGLAFAHENGVVHRDIKPANLLLDAKGTVKILDMGLARIHDAAVQAAKEGLTKSGDVMGTVDYMAPEQAFDTHQADGRADIYSLGCTLYRLLTGQNMYEADSLVKKLMAHQSKPIPTLRLARPDIPAELEAIFQRMVAKSVEDRYQTMADVISSLEPLLSQSAAALKKESESKLKSFFSGLTGGSPKTGAEAPAAAVAAQVACAAPSVPEPSPTLSLSHSAQSTDPVSDRSIAAARTSFPQLLRSKSPGAGWLSRATLIAAGLGGVLLVLFGIRVIVKDKNGKEVARVKVPGGGAAETKELPATKLNTKSISPPQATGEAIDLLAQVELPADSVKRSNFGDWTREGRILLSPATGKSGLVCVRYQPPPEYELTAVVERVHGTDGVIFGAVVDGHPTGVCFDMYPTRISGLTLLDGKHADVNEATVQKPVLTETKPQTIRIVVGKRSIRASVDDREVIHWEGDPKRLSSSEIFPHPKDLWFGAGFHQFKFHKLELRPLVSAPATANLSQDNALPIAKAPFNAQHARAHQEAWAKHLGVPVEYTNSIGMKFALIPPGEFTMGSAPEVIEAMVKSTFQDKHWHDLLKSAGPQHKVILTQPIYLGIHEVTQAQYEKVMRNNPSFFAKSGAVPKWAEKVVGLDTSSHPVEGATWNEAGEFCAKLSEQEKLKPCYSRSGETITMLAGTGYRLPTEAQWEFACRAGATTKYWFGDKDEDFPQSAWTRANSTGRTHPVGQLTANPFGLYDVHGNLWEWVQDGWEPTYYHQFQNTTAQDPSGPTAAASERAIAGGKRVIKGGDWDAIYPTAEIRLAFAPTSRESIIGFRVALPVDAVKAAGASPVSQPTDSWINLLPLIIPAQEANGNGVRRENAEIVVGHRADLILPPSIQGNYQLRASFTTWDGPKHLQLVLPVAGRLPELVLYAADNETGYAGAGLSGLDGRAAIDAQNPTHIMERLVFANQKHSLQLTVSSQGDQVTIRATIDDKPLVNWTGAASRLNAASEKSPHQLVFKVYKGWLKLHTLELQQFKGNAATTSQTSPPQAPGN